MKGSGKRKGTAYERKICNALSKWVSNGKRHDIFWRSAISGGRATTAYKKGQILSRQAGDICAVSPEGHDLTNLFYFELKHYRSLQLGHALISEGLLMKFWELTAGQAVIYDRKPVLIAKQNHFPTLIIVNEELGSTIRIVSMINYKGLYLLYVYLFDDLMETPYKKFIM